MPVSAIDPQEFGRVQAEVAGLRRDNDRLLALVEKLSLQMDDVELRLSEARGSWKALMFIGGAAASLGSVGTWALTHLSGRGMT